MPENNLVRLGNCMRQARKARGFTQERLAEESGVSVRHIAKIEKGTMNPSFDKLSSLVRTLGISFDTLFFPDEDVVDADIKRLTGLYRACPPDGQRYIKAAVQALANESIDTEQELNKNK